MKLRHLIPILLLALCILATPAAAAGGAGTASNPYVIQTPAELQSMQNDLSAHYILGNDIDMSGYSFVPIGSTSAPFFGSLDGKGYKISNLNINLPDTSRIGLFSAISSTAQISNLKFDNCIISGASNIGCLYGSCIFSTLNAGYLRNISCIDVEVHGSGNAVGGIGGGIFVGTTSDVSLLSSTVTGDYIVGGIFGYGLSASNTACSISNILVSDTHVFANERLVGGICGFGSNSAGSILSINNIDISNTLIESSNGPNIGGVCGYASDISANCVISNIFIDNCIISGSSRVGGIAGTITSGALSSGGIDSCDVYNTSIKSTGNYAGGISGGGGRGSISGCSVANTTVQASSYAAGICPSFG